MEIKIINTEYSIGACESEYIPEWVTRFGEKRDLAFFYYHERDCIVINEDNVNYDLYKQIIEGYLKLTDEGRRYLMKAAKIESDVFYEALRCINYIIRIRRKLYKNVKKSEKREAIRRRVLPALKTGDINSHYFAPAQILF